MTIKGNLEEATRTFYSENIAASQSEATQFFMVFLCHPFLSPMASLQRKPAQAHWASSVPPTGFKGLKVKRMLPACSVPSAYTAFPFCCSFGVL